MKIHHRGTEDTEFDTCESILYGFIDFTLCDLFISCVRNREKSMWEKREGK